jgi:hypothetical protein
MIAALGTTEAAELVESLTGRRPSRVTVSRWIASGVDGVRLPARRVGGRLAIQSDDLRRFLGLTEVERQPD